MRTSDLSADSIDSRGILLTGDIDRAFLDADAVRQLPCKIMPNMLDAIDTAGRDRFTVIAVVMSGGLARLSSALKALRDVNSGAKIVLLAQMHQEPAAIELVGWGLEGANIADDYVICPVRLSRFRELVEPAAVGVAAEGTVRVDADTEMKIKELEKLATEDELTGLKNRRYIWEFCKQVIERARQGDRRVTLLVSDIDNLDNEICWDYTSTPNLIVTTDDICSQANISASSPTWYGTETVNATVSDGDKTDTEPVVINIQSILSFSDLIITIDGSDNPAEDGETVGEAHPDSEISLSVKLKNNYPQLSK